MADHARVLDTPDKIADAGEQLYADRYKDALESDHRGHFVAIDVLTGEAYVAEYPEQALQKARSEAPNGVFHLIRVGAPGAFKVSSGSSRDAFWTRTLRQPR
jgi:hypothetical protein